MTTEKQAARQARCTHRWVLPPPNGPTSVARCRNCHASKTMLTGWLGDYNEAETARLSGLMQIGKGVRSGSLTQLRSSVTTAPERAAKATAAAADVAHQKRLKKNPFTEAHEWQERQE